MSERQEKAKRVFALSRTEFLFVIIIILFGVNMYYNAQLKQDSDKETQRDAQQQKEGVDFAISQNKELIESDNNQTILLTELIERANVRGNATVTGFNAVVTSMNQSLEDVTNDLETIIEKDANLTKEEQDDLIKTLQYTIPLLSNQTAEMLNVTQTVTKFIDYIGNAFDAEYLIDEVRQYNQSNFTQAEIPKIQEKLDKILNNITG